jgi:hypothetical protein
MLLKQIKQGVFVLLHAVYMLPVIKIYHSYKFNSTGLFLSPWNILKIRNK